MRQLLSILIYSNSWVALCVASLVVGVATHFHVLHPETYAIWSFTGTVSAYQLHRLFRLRQLKHSVRTNRRLLWMQKTYTFQLVWFGLNCLGFSIATSYLPLSQNGFYLLGLNAIIVGLYALPLPIIGNGIRNLPFLKNLLISASWSCIVIYAIVVEKNRIPWEIILIISLSVFAQIVPFDIRDKNFDKRSMMTIPQLVGSEPARVIGFSLLLTAVFFQFQLIGFHWMMIPVILSGFVGHFLPYGVGVQLRLEFCWELPLGLMGLWFWVV